MSEGPWHLLSPDGQLVSCPDRKQLTVFCKHNKLKKFNVELLLGIAVGNTVRKAHEANWVTRDSIRFLQRGNELVYTVGATFGRDAGKWFVQRVVKQRGDMPFEAPELADLLAIPQKRAELCGWRVVEWPENAVQLIGRGLHLQASVRAAEVSGLPTSMPLPMVAAQAAQSSRQPAAQPGASVTAMTASATKRCSRCGRRGYGCSTSWAYHTNCNPPK
mmetsp:Transcript_38438/g.63686  ORF Transcript_38438/g.63686 Transcript_38438/m.63686 type:complete len:218 (-) Transcript_38438:95-748(-)